MQDQENPFKHTPLEKRADEFDERLGLDRDFDWRKPVGKEILE
jgi:hypothetical protein